MSWDVLGYIQLFEGTEYPFQLGGINTSPAIRELDYTDPAFLDVAIDRAAAHLDHSCDLGKGKSRHGPTVYQDTNQKYIL